MRARAPPWGRTRRACRSRRRAPCGWRTGPAPDPGAHPGLHTRTARAFTDRQGQAASTLKALSCHAAHCALRLVAVVQGVDRQCVGTLPKEQQGSGLPWAPLTARGPQRDLTHEHGDSTTASRGPGGPCRVHGNVGCHHERKPPIPCSAFHPVHGIEQRSRAAIACIEGVDSLHMDSAACSADARSACSALLMCAHAMIGHTHCSREDMRTAVPRTGQIPAEAVGNAPRYHGCRARQTGSSGRS